MNLRDSILAQLKTPFHALMLALSPIRYRTAWFEFREPGGVVCRLCGGTIADTHDILALKNIATHEVEHIALLEPDKVAAAMALYTFRKSEGVNLHEATIWQEIFIEVWGGRPSVALPARTASNNNQPKDHDP